MDGDKIVTTLVAEDDMSEALDEAAKSGEKLGETFEEVSANYEHDFEAMNQATDDFVEEVDPLAEFLAETKAQFDEMADSLDGMETSLEDGKDALDAEADAAEQAGGSQDELAQAMDKTVDYAGDLEKELEELEKEIEGTDEASGSWLETLSQVGMIIAGVKAGTDLFSGAVQSLTNTIKGWVDAGGESELATVRMGAVLDVAGKNVGYTKDQLVALADQLEKTTRFESETTQGAMSMMLAFKNVRGDIFKQAVESAANLAEVMGNDITGASRQLAMALEQPGQGLERLKRAGVTFTEEEKDKIKTLAASGKALEAQQMILDKVKAATDGVAEKVGGSFVGQMTIAQHRLGNLSEDMGKMFIPVIMEMIPLIDLAINAFERMRPTIEAVIKATIDWAKETATSLKPTFEWLVDALIATGTVIELAVTRWQDVFALAGESIAYSVVKMYNQVAYYLTEVLPTILKWFADHFIDVLKDMHEFNKVILSNMGSNIANFIAYVRDLLMGRGGEFEFVGLTEGFETSLKKLPQIAARVEGELEKTLREDMEHMAESLGTDFARRLERNTRAVREVVKDVEDEAMGEASGTGDIDLGRRDKKEKKKKKDGKDSGGFEGLEELFNRISGAAGKSPEDKVADAVHAEGVAAQMTRKQMLIAANENIKIGRAIRDKARAGAAFEGVRRF